MSKRIQDDKAPMFDYYWRIFGGDLPRPKPEVNFDWAWPEYRVAVEVDGGQYSKFGGRHSSDADREKLNIAASLRWLVFRFSPQQLDKDPEGCIRLVAQAIKDSM